MRQLTRPRNTVMGVKAFMLLKGSGIEIGALSRPFDLDATVTYADTTPAEEMRAHLDQIAGRPYQDEDLVKVDIILSPPFFRMPQIPTSQYDFVCNSHVFEHTPNPGLALEEWLRVVKPGGHVYIIAPDMNYTYDRARVLTQPEYLIQRFLNRTVSFGTEDYEEMLALTWDHPEYADKSPQNRERLMAQGTGPHHLHTFTAASFLDFAVRMQKYLPFDIVHFDSQGIDIHIALKKR